MKNITLYKKTSTGAIQTWNISIYQGLGMFDTPQIRIVQGQLNGKLQTYQESVEEGKQGRTPLEQAEMMVDAKVKDKQYGGYKSLEDMKITFKDGVYHKDNSAEGRGDEGSTNLKTLLEMSMPKEATDVNGIVKPMLAQPITRVLKGVEKSHWDKVTYPIAGEYKLDGVRCLIYATVVQEGLIQVSAISREGRSYDFATSKIRASLTALFLDNPDTILDGELYVHGMNQNRISGSMRKGEYDPELHDLMEYHVYDIVRTVSNYKYRKGLLGQLYDKYKSFVIVTMKVLYSREDVDIFEEEAVDKGYEGIMLKPLDGIYTPGKRSFANLKVKRFYDGEYRITGYKLGKRGVQDICLKCETEEGEVFWPTVTGTLAEKQVLLEQIVYDQNHEGEEGYDTKVLDKMGTIKYKFISEYGVPNHCHFKEVRNYE